MCVNTFEGLPSLDAWTFEHLECVSSVVLLHVKKVQIRWVAFCCKLTVLWWILDVCASAHWRTLFCMSFWANQCDGLFCVAVFAEVTYFVGPQKLLWTRIYLIYTLLSRFNHLLKRLLSTVMRWWRFTIFHNLRCIECADLFQIFPGECLTAKVVIAKQLGILCPDVAPETTSTSLNTELHKGPLCGVTLQFWPYSVLSERRLYSSIARRRRFGILKNGGINSKKS